MSARAIQQSIRGGAEELSVASMIYNSGTVAQYPFPTQPTVAQPLLRCHTSKH